MNGFLAPVLTRFRRIGAHALEPLSRRERGWGEGNEGETANHRGRTALRGCLLDATTRRQQQDGFQLSLE